VSHREPIFNAPGVVVWLLLAFAAVHVVRWWLPEDQGEWLTALLAFIPARLTGLAEQLPGGGPAAITAFVTHVFVHGDITHLIVNSAWLLAFGSPVARRTDWLPFILFFLLSGTAGALFYFAINGGVLTVVVGASGAISGLMGAAFRFMFRGMEEGGPLGLAHAARRTPLMRLGETLQDRRILLAVAGWTILNVLLAWGASGLTEAAGIAWEAHLGGFYFGLLTFGLFDRKRSIEDNGEDDAADAG
jgi:membrane associated rhomboid family serine protease